MEKILTALLKCSLFRDLDQAGLEKILNKTKYTISRYSIGQVLAVEGDSCTALGIVLDGNIEVQRVYASGKVVVMAQMGPGDIFGEAIIFTELHQYPATIVAVEGCRIMYIASEDIIKLCSQHHLVLRRFMEHLSTKILMLNKKIRDLSFDTLRQKIAVFLLEEYGKQKKLELSLPMSKKSLAELLGVQRPSLSRELIHMRQEGLLDFAKDKIIIRDLAALEELVI